jgi:hypothetical protein
VAFWIEDFRFKMDCNLESEIFKLKLQRQYI